MVQREKRRINIDVSPEEFDMIHSRKSKTLREHLLLSIGVEPVPLRMGRPPTDDQLEMEWKKVVCESNSHQYMTQKRVGDASTCPVCGFVSYITNDTFYERGKEK